MTTIELSEDNVEEYEEWLTPDVAENLEREYYRGLVVADDDGDPVAGMVFELLYTEDDRPVESAIRWFKILDEDAADPLFSEYKEIIREADVEKSSFVIPVKDSTKEKAALKAAGFTVKLTEGDNIVVTLEELLKLPIMKSRAVPDNICVLNQITTRVFRRVISKCVTMNRKGVCEDLAYLPLSWFDPDVSCYSEKDGEINGLFLFHRLPSGMLTVQLMVALTSEAQAIILGMMRQFVISLEEVYGSDVKVILDRHNQSSLQLTEKLLPRGFGIPVYAGSREE